jgi:hypothetical protein
MRPKPISAQPQPPHLIFFKKYDTILKKGSCRAQEPKIFDFFKIL